MRKRKKTLLFTLILVVASTFLFASDIYKATSDLKFRKEPNTHSHSLGLIKSGNELKVIDKTNPDWFKIEYDGKTGYVSSKYLSFFKTEEIKKAAPPVVVKQEEKTSSFTIALIIIGVFVFIYLIGKAGKKEVKKKTPKEMDDERREKIKRSIKVTIGNDTSVIDVTGKQINISSHTGFTQGNVPFWKHQYVFSFSDLNGATKEQKQFYELFKSEFKKGNYIELQGNLNYAFILLFDVLQEYEKHSSLNILENQINKLGEFYPKTKSYGIDFLIKRMEKAGDSVGVNRLRGSQYRYTETYDYDYWKLGNQYKTKLSLKDNEVALLNNLIDTGNKFNKLEFFATNLIKLFLETVGYLESTFKKDGTTFQERSNSIATIEIQKHYRFRDGSYNYKTTFDIFINNVYQSIYKICENALRDKYNVGRKTELAWYIHSEQALNEFKNRFENHINEILPDLVSKLPVPDSITELKLNEYCKTRWKIKIEEIENNFKESKVEDYIKSIQILGKENDRNPSVENIYFQASKFIAKHDKLSALSFYIEYLYSDLVSIKFDNKQLTKTIQKSLFKTEEQLREFELVVADLVKTKNKKKALASIETLYAPKRKKIKLDSSAIKEVHEKHSDTVELLNEYLQDDNETENIVVKTPEVITDNIQIQLSETKDAPKTQLTSKVNLNPNQLEFIDFLSKNSFAISQEQLKVFAKSKGVLKNQLVESINEKCFDIIDDVLIEEEGENYIINESYYQQIFEQ